MSKFIEFIQVFEPSEMAGGRRIWLVPWLVLFFFTWSLVKNLPPPSENHSRFLVEDTLLAACDAVRDAMLTLLEAQKDELRTTFERDTIGHLGTKLERLQASLDNLHGESLLRKLAVGEFSSSGRIKGSHIADIDLCGSLAGKRITMIGGEHIYQLHVLLLQHRERAEKKLFPCPYHEFCTHHHICLPFQHSRDQVPLPRYIKPPTTQDLIETESAAVNYIVSDTLFSAPNESSWEYTLLFMDPMTGVRLRETFWLAAARKANVVILGRGPLSAPGQTYTGNWSFLHHVPDYVDKSRASITGEYEDHHDDPTVPRPLEILNAAVHLTVSRFLPDLFQLLQSIRREVHPSRRKRLIWPSQWYRLPGRGAARTAVLRPYIRSTLQGMTQQTHFLNQWPRSSVEHILTLQLSALINADVTNMILLEDPWTFLFNAQGEYMV